MPASDQQIEQLRTRGYTDDFKARLALSGEDLVRFRRYAAQSADALHDRAMVAAAYWLGSSPHEHTYLDGLICALYAVAAAAQIEALREQLALLQATVDAIDNELHEPGDDRGTAEIVFATIADLQRQVADATAPAQKKGGA